MITTYSIDLQGSTQIMVSKQDADGDGLYLRLEVKPSASREEIASAHRRLAHDAHPDAHPGDPDAPRRFREITEAYEVLGDPARRERYDRARDQARVAMSETSRVRAGSPSAPAQVFAPPLAAGGPSVFLGTGPVSEPGPALSVGPVHVRPSRPGPPVAVTPEDARAALWAQLLSEMFEPRRRP
jgi:curved DNA-binding protein CbpA